MRPGLLSLPNASGTQRERRGARLAIVLGVTIRLIVLSAAASSAVGLGPLTWGWEASTGFTAAGAPGAGTLYVIGLDT